jgi:hypothetical protein
MEFIKQIELFKEAGINLIRESMLIFSKPQLLDDFSTNMQSYLKSIICNVIVKSGGKLNRRDIFEYKVLLEKEFELLKDPSLYLQAMDAMRYALKGMPLFIFKARLKSFIPAKHLKFARYIQSMISKYRKMAF